MNVLEVYIEKIHSVKAHEHEPWMDKFPGLKLVDVDISTNCYGRRKRSISTFETKEWENIKSQGYYMA